MYSERTESCSKRLATALSIRQMRQTDLCAKTKIPKSAMSLYLSGAYEPKQDRLYVIAEALDVDPVWLMGFDVSMEKKDKKTSSPDKLALTEGERVLIDLFKQVPEDKQKLVIEMIRAALGTRE